MKLVQFVQTMQNLLENTNFKGNTYIVGGVVRDYLLAKQCFTDFDLVVEKPHGGLKLGAFLKRRLKPNTYEAFPRFGSARMTWNGISMDFVETRKEEYRPGFRFPKIRFCPIDEDVFRRDFSVNALYMDLFNMNILDPSNLGRQDIQNKLIRTIRAPEIVFNEDYLRILRAIRFALCTEFSLESNTANALKISAHKIRNLSTNQIRRELVKIRDRGKLDQAKQILEDLELSDILACIQ